MPKRLCFLVSIVLLLGLSSAVPANPIDVNNHSFEYNIDGQFITEQTWTGDLQGWGFRDNTGYSGWQFVGVEWAWSKGEAYEAADGNACAFWCTSDVPEDPNLYCELYQILEDEEAVIVGDRRYTMTFNALRLGTATATAYGALYYSTGTGEYQPNDVILASEQPVLTWPTWGEPDYAGWEEFIVRCVIPSEAACIGKNLGVKLSVPQNDPDGYQVVLDNVRLEWKWSSDAWDPNPADGTEDIARDVTLSWTPGVWAKNTDGHEIYLGTSFDDVNNADRFDVSGIYQCAQDSNTWSVLDYDANGLDLGKVYYWRIDEVNEAYSGSAPQLPDGRWKGEVWSFEVTGYASNPVPHDQATEVSVNVELSWTPGTDSDTHDVYIGTDEAAVGSAGTGDEEYKGNHEQNAYDPNLSLDTTYYWRIDEVNDVIIKGKVWSFTTGTYVIVDDMDSYGLSVNKIEETWEDYWINDTGAEVFLNTDDANFVCDGNSMLYEYDNMYKGAGNLFGSLAEASISNLEISSNWTLNGGKALTLSFYGVSDNTPTVNDRLYVALSDGTDVGVVYYPDINALTEEEWHEWNIDFEDFNSIGVDMTNISEIAVGFGVYGGSSTKGTRGKVYFDDFRVYPTRCKPELSPLAGDVDMDCVVDGYDLGIMASDWLLGDYDLVPAAPPNAPELWYRFDEGTGLVTANSGDLAGHDIAFDDDAYDPVWTTDAAPAVDQLDPNYALEFDGSGDYLDIPNSPALPFVGIQNMTITAWIKPADYMGEWDWPSIVESRNDANAGLASGFGFGSWGELIYWWNNDYWDWSSDLWPDAGVWSFVAVTIEPTQATIYFYDGSLHSSTYIVPHAPLVDWDTDYNHLIGVNTSGTPYSTFEGNIDDVRIYDYTLSRDNILYITDMPPYVPLTSPANLYDEEPPYSKYVNLKDFAVLADDWLTEAFWP